MTEPSGGAGGPPPRRVGISLPPERRGDSGAQPPPPGQQPAPAMAEQEPQVRANRRNYYLKSSPALCALVQNEEIDHKAMNPQQALAYRPHLSARSVREELANSSYGDLVEQFQTSWWKGSKAKTNLGAWASQAMEIHRAAGYSIDGTHSQQQQNQQPPVPPFQPVGVPNNQLVAVPGGPFPHHFQGQHHFQYGIPPSAQYGQQHQQLGHAGAGIGMGPGNNVHGPHQQYHHPLGHAGAGIGMGQGMAGQQLLQYGGQQQPFVSAGHTGTVPGAGGDFAANEAPAPTSAPADADTDDPRGTSIRGTIHDRPTVSTPVSRTGLDPHGTTLSELKRGPNSTNLTEGRHRNRMTEGKRHLDPSPRHDGAAGKNTANASTIRGRDEAQTNRSVTFAPTDPPATTAASLNFPATPAANKATPAKGRNTFTAPSMSSNSLAQGGQDLSSRAKLSGEAQIEPSATTAPLSFPATPAANKATPAKGRNTFTAPSMSSNSLAQGGQDLSSRAKLSGEAQIEPSATTAPLSFPATPAANKATPAKGALHNVGDLSPYKEVILPQRTLVDTSSGQRNKKKQSVLSPSEIVESSLKKRSSKKDEKRTKKKSRRSRVEMLDVVLQKFDEVGQKRIDEVQEKRREADARAELELQEMKKMAEEEEDKLFKAADKAKDEKYEAADKAKDEKYEAADKAKDEKYEAADKAKDEKYEATKSAYKTKGQATAKKFDAQEKNADEEDKAKEIIYAGKSNILTMMAKSLVSNNSVYSSDTSPSMTNSSGSTPTSQTSGESSVEAKHFSFSLSPESQGSGRSTCAPQNVLTPRSTDDILPPVAEDPFAAPASEDNVNDASMAHRNESIGESPATIHSVAAAPPSVIIPEPDNSASSSMPSPIESPPNAPQNVLAPRSTDDILPPVAEEPFAAPASEDNVNDASMAHRNESIGESPATIHSVAAAPPSVIIPEPDNSASSSMPSPIESPPNDFSGTSSVNSAVSMEELSAVEMDDNRKDADTLSTALKCTEQIMAMLRSTNSDIVAEGAAKIKSLLDNPSINNDHLRCLFDSSFLSAPSFENIDEFKVVQRIFGMMSNDDAVVLYQSIFQDTVVSREGTEDQGADRKKAVYLAAIVARSTSIFVRLVPFLTERLMSNDKLQQEAAIDAIMCGVHHSEMHKETAHAFFGMMETLLPKIFDVAQGNRTDFLVRGALLEIGFALAKLAGIVEMSKREQLFLSKVTIRAIQFLGDSPTRSVDMDRTLRAAGAMTLVPVLCGTNDPAKILSVSLPVLHYCVEKKQLDQKDVENVLSIKSLSDSTNALVRLTLEASDSTKFNKFKWQAIEYLCSTWKHVQDAESCLTLIESMSLTVSSLPSFGEAPDPTLSKIDVKLHILGCVSFYLKKEPGSIDGSELRSAIELFLAFASVSQKNQNSEIEYFPSLYVDMFNHCASPEVWPGLAEIAGLGVLSDEQARKLLEWGSTAMSKAPIYKGTNGHRDEEVLDPISSSLLLLIGVLEGGYDIPFESARSDFLNLLCSLSKDERYSNCDLIDAIFDFFPVPKSSANQLSSMVERQRQIFEEQAVLRRNNPKCELDPKYIASYDHVRKRAFDESYQNFNEGKLSHIEMIDIGVNLSDGFGDFPELTQLLTGILTGNSSALNVLRSGKTPIFTMGSNSTASLHFELHPSLQYNSEHAEDVYCEVLRPLLLQEGGTSIRLRISGTEDEIGLHTSFSQNSSYESGFLTSVVLAVANSVQAKPDYYSQVHLDGSNNESAGPLNCSVNALSSLLQTGIKCIFHNFVLNAGGYHDLHLIRMFEGRANVCLERCVTQRPQMALAKGTGSVSLTISRSWAIEPEILTPHLKGMSGEGKILSLAFTNLDLDGDGVIERACQLRELCQNAQAQGFALSADSEDIDKPNVVVLDIDGDQADELRGIFGVVRPTVPTLNDSADTSSPPSTPTGEKMRASSPNPLFAALVKMQKEQQKCKVCYQFYSKDDGKCPCCETPNPARLDDDRIDSKQSPDAADTAATATASNSSAADVSVVGDASGAGIGSTEPVSQFSTTSAPVGFGAQNGSADQFFAFKSSFFGQGNASATSDPVSTADKAERLEAPAHPLASASSSFFGSSDTGTNGITEAVSSDLSAPIAISNDGTNRDFSGAATSSRPSATSRQENEKEVYRSNVLKSNVYNSCTKEWEENGCGQIKITIQGGVFRLVMRQQGTGVVRMNHSFVNATDLMPNAGSDSAWVWNAVDCSTSENSAKTYSVDFGSTEAAENFKDMYQLAKEGRMTDLAEGDVSAAKGASEEDTNAEGDATISPSAHIAPVPTAAVENGVDDDEEEAESEQDDAAASTNISVGDYVKSTVKSNSSEKYGKGGKVEGFSGSGRSCHVADIFIVGDDGSRIPANDAPWRNVPLSQLEKIEK